MKTVRSLTRWFALGICGSCLTAAHADQPTFTDMTEMARRLEAAEQRIIDLEARRLPVIEASHTLNTAWQDDDEDEARNSLADRVEVLGEGTRKAKRKGSQGQVGRGQEADPEMVRPYPRRLLGVPR